MDRLKGNAAWFRQPVIDPNELRDQHCKVYASKSVKKAVQDFANREGLTFSEAGLRLWIIAFGDDLVFGGYKLPKELSLSDVISDAVNNGLLTVDQE